jgi:hypothetical protein
LFEDTEDFPPQPTQPPDLADGSVIGDDGREYGPLGGVVGEDQPGGVIMKGSLPFGVIISVVKICCKSKILYKHSRQILCYNNFRITIL